MNHSREFYQILSEYLCENAMTQAEFAKKVNVKPNLVSKWLHGVAKPDYDNLRKIAISLHLPVDYLLGIIATYR